MGFRTVTLARMEIAHVDSARLLDHVFASLAASRGGFVLTANLDILRRHSLDHSARALYDAADVRVADGMPLVWASAIAGDPLPERIAGAFTLREVDGHTSEEICEILGISTNNLWVMLYRARTHLRRCLELNWFARQPAKG